MIDEERSLTEAVSALAELERDLAAVPGVRKVTGLASYIGLMHERLTGAAPGVMPEAPNAAAQYLLLYESSGDPGDFEEEVDYDYRTALLRAQLATDRYSDTRAAVAEFNERTQAWSDRTGLDAQVGGRVAVNEGWMSRLSVSHFQGLGLALLFVALGTTVLFRSVSLGFVATVPMLTGVALVYAVMSAFGIAIAPATSLCAALATGLGVDFGVHLGKELRIGALAGQDIHTTLTGRYGLVAKGGPGGGA